MDEALHHRRPRSPHSVFFNFPLDVSNEHLRTPRATCNSPTALHSLGGSELMTAVTYRPIAR
jgi:hypothetical protein